MLALPLLAMGLLYLPLACYALPPLHARLAHEAQISFLAEHSQDRGPDSAS